MADQTEVCVPTPEFQDILEGRKTFVIVKSNELKEGSSYLWLREWLNGPTGRSIHKSVVYLMEGAEQLLPSSHTGLHEDFTVVGLGPAPWRCGGVYGDPSKMYRTRGLW